MFWGDEVLEGVSELIFVVGREGKSGDAAYRVGVVERREIISLGKLARKAPRQLIVRGTYEALVPPFSFPGFVFC